MKQRFTLFLSMAMACSFALAGPIGLEQARGKAAKFMKERIGGAVLANEIPEYAPARSLKGAKTPNETPAYYIFNAEDERGYVIISGDDKTDEILGYSTHGSFDAGNMPENVKAWLQSYTEQIAMLDTYVPQQNIEQNTTQWPAIYPLVRTQWNQGEPYNAKCPLHNGNRSVTGCTATAMAQVMKYHEWPQTATPKIPSYTTTSENIRVSTLPSTTFDWNEMKNTYSSNDNGDAVAELMRYCGQSIESDYSEYSTGAYTSDVVNALTKYFDYDQNIEQKYLFFYTLSEWESIIYNELKASRPVYHAGASMEGGHAFICDGYDGDGMFHFNWGWGGSYDGYYKLALMNPETGGIGSGSSDGYSYGQEIVIGIQPNTGKAPAPKYFEPHSEQVIGTSMFSFFYNTHAETLTANVGFATIDEDNNIIKVIKDCGPKTLLGNLGDTDYIGLDIAADGLRLAAGVHRIATVCRPNGTSTWKRVGSYQNFFEVTTSTLGTVTNIVQHPTINVNFTDWKAVGNNVEGVQQDFIVSLENTGDEVYTLLYLFASKTNIKGKAQSRATILMKKNEVTDLYLSFTPTSSGVYNLWLSQSEKGEDHIAKTTVTIKPAPVLPSNLTMLSCVPDKNKVSANVRIRNNSSEGYYRGIVAILFEKIDDSNYLYATEVQELPGNINAGTTKTFNFQFHGANSYNQCALLIGYYQNHSDLNYTQLGNYIYFTTGETPVESIQGTFDKESPIYRIDGIKVNGEQVNGLHIIQGKKLIAR